MLSNGARQKLKGFIDNLINDDTPRYRLTKKQVLESNYQGWFILKVSIATGSIVGMIILIATVSYQNAIDLPTMIFSHIVILAVMGYFLSYMHKTHNKHIDCINELMIKVEKAERLETIQELRKQYNKKSLKPNIRK